MNIDDAVVAVEKQLAAMKDVVGHRPDDNYEYDAVTDPDAREVVTLLWVLKVLKGTATPTPESTP
jgi:hypothetical protein